MSEEQTENRTEELRIPPEVAHRLGHYVYLYIDPRNEQPFYVGKGQGGRALSHLSEAAESRKCARIAELRAEGKEPRVDILAHGLRDEETAFRIVESWHEAATTAYATRDASQLSRNGRREFLGRVAEAAIRDQYVGRSVAEDFKPGLQNPVLYVNC